MLAITVPELESYDEASSRLIKSESYTFQLEHSLASLSKWESEFERPFLTDGPKTPEETIAYVKCMTLTDGVPESIYTRLSSENYVQINNHINAKMTATWFNDRPQPGRGREVITSEVIYYWLTSYNIPFECDQWHLNRLLALVKVANAKNAPKKKMGRRDMLAQRDQINAARKAQAQSKG